MFRNAVVSLILLASTVVYAAPTVHIINGSPLTIHIGSDTSFQVLNSAIGPTPQIFPPFSSQALADAGIMAVVQGELFAPDFSAHGLTAASHALAATPWTSISMSAVSGTGTTPDPFTVTVVVDAGTTGVRLKAIYTYVNGDPFFRITKVFTSTSTVSMNIYLGADFYLASYDIGVPYREPASSSPGGQDCGKTPSYTILLIPTTPADHYTAANYYTVWSQIGTLGNLTDSVENGCIDNGAAVEWQRMILAGGSTTITSAVSFGPIPTIVNFNVTSVSPPQGNQGQTLTVVVNGTGFEGGTTFDFGPGITVVSTAINSSSQATVTISIASTATPGPRNVTGTQSPGGLTANLINGFTVIATPQCGRVAPVRVLCATDGSGDYFVTFTFQNGSTEMIENIFLTELGGGAAAAPNYVHLSPAIIPGGSATIGPIRVHGASPGTLSMTLTAYNGQLVQCCQADVRFELPDCSCAQIAESSGPSCRPFSNNYTYTFTYQNLFHGPVQQLLITPDAASTAIFTPDVIALDPPMGYGDTRSFTLQISNVSASQPLCLRITSNSNECEHCCTIRRCVTLPRCIGDAVHVTGNGDTIVTINEPFLTIESPTNEPACFFPLAPDTHIVDLEWQPVTAKLAAGAFLEQKYRGSVGQVNDATIATARNVVTSTGSELQTSFDAFSATRYDYVFLNRSEVTATENGIGTATPATCNGCANLQTDFHFFFRDSTTGEEDSRPCNSNLPPALHPNELCLFLGYTYPRPLEFNLAATKAFGDEIEAAPEHVPATRVKLSGLDFHAHGMASVTFRDLRVIVDCNSNGVDDFTDIATGASLDTDRDGVPDECEIRRADLSVSLNTGVDDSWRLINTPAAGVAGVVRNPVSPWAAPLPGSAWISASADRGDSIPGVSTLEFENCFCMGANARSASLDLQVHADDFATVFLNDTKVSDTGGAFNTLPLAVHLSGAVGATGPFHLGRNCVRIEVMDKGIVTGLDAVGAIRAQNGACP